MNDNAPVIVDPVETVLSVQGRAPPGTPIARILATDPDLGDGGNLVYTIDNGRIHVYTNISPLPYS